MIKLKNMREMIAIIFITTLIMGCAHASQQTIEIGGADFEIPSKYQGGELKDNQYSLDNNFSIRCVDNDVCGKIGLWACENDFSEDINIGDHPVRHFCQYNKYVNGNHSHAYFASNHSVYEISWTGKEINKDIEKLIINSPASEIKKDSFYSALDESVSIYKQQRIDKLNQEAEYNNLEAKYNSQSHQDRGDDAQLKEILLTHYN